MKNIALIATAGMLLVLAAAAAAQPASFTLPLNIQKAVEKGTRTDDGLPGPKYWQNHSVYSIRASFDPATRALTGEETVRYTNESPDTLRSIVLRLYQNFFRKGAARDFQVSPNDLHDGVDIRALVVDGQEYIKGDTRRNTNVYGTNMFIRLLSPLAPGATAKLDVAWSLVIAKESPIRMGTFDSSSFFIGFWFPQIAVYDDIDGWDQVQYRGTVEFYNDFSDYDLELTVPKNFVVWATGVLQNPSEVLAPDVLTRYQRALQSDSVVRIIRPEDIGKTALTAGTGPVVWKFKASHVPDASFALSDHYCWDASRLTVDRAAGRTAFIAAAYKQESSDFHDVAAIARKSIDFFSTVMPAVPYPYPCMTVFNGSGGMEYPMMVNDGSTGSYSAAIGLTSHEIAHTYFPFYMGINERKYAWMDEGWAVMLPFAFQADEGKPNDPLLNNASAYGSFAGTESDIPMMVLSHQLTDASYRYATYARPGIAYEYLRDLLGTEQFLKALHAYMAAWNGKHPVPYDFFNSFNRTTGQDLSWFWRPWFFETGYADLGLRSGKNTKGTTEFFVDRRGTLPVPVDVEITCADGTTETIHHPASVWKGSVKTLPLNIKSGKQVKKLVLGSGRIPDSRKEDNVLEVPGH